MAWSGRTRDDTSVNTYGEFTRLTTFDRDDEYGVGAGTLLVHVC